MVSYGVGDVSPDMSFLEMLDVLNEQLTGARAMQMINQHDEEGFGACTQCGGHHRTQPTPHPHRRRTSNPRNGQTHRGRCPTACLRSPHRRRAERTAAHPRSLPAPRPQRQRRRHPGRGSVTRHEVTVPTLAFVRLPQDRDPRRLCAEVFGRSGSGSPTGRPRRAADSAVSWSARSSSAPSRRCARHVAPVESRRVQRSLSSIAISGAA